MALAGIIVAIVIVGLICIPLVLKNLLYICQPNEVLVFSGDRRDVGDGRTVGYRLIKGGRAYRRPFVERVDRLDLTNMAIDVQVANAYSKGGIPLNIQAVANVKIAGDEPIINNAIERFIGKGRQEIMRIAKETLEGNLRGILATLTPEEVNDDKLAFQQSLVEEAEQDLNRLGLLLDTLNIQNVSDEKKYLDSIGRRRSADLQKRAFIAEVTSKADAEVRAAENFRETELAKVEADGAIVEADVERRIIDAETRRGAVIAEEQSTTKAEVVRANAQVSVQEARIEQVTRRLQADVVQPARAALSAAEAKARGDAAPIIENARATSTVLSEIAGHWRESGGAAKDVFLTQKLESMIAILTGTIGNLEVNRLTILGRDASVGGSTDQSWPVKAAVASEQLKAVTGVDAPALLASIAERLGSGDPGETDDEES